MPTATPPCGPPRPAPSDGDGTLVATTTTVACLDRRSAEAWPAPPRPSTASPTDVRGLTLAFPPATPARGPDGVGRHRAGRRCRRGSSGTERFCGLEVRGSSRRSPSRWSTRSPCPARWSARRADGGRRRRVPHHAQPARRAGQRRRRLDRGSPADGAAAPDGRPAPVLLGGTFPRPRRASSAPSPARGRSSTGRSRRHGPTLDVGGAGVVLLVRRPARRRSRRGGAPRGRRGRARPAARPHRLSGGRSSAWRRSHWHARRSRGRGRHARRRPRAAPARPGRPAAAASRRPWSASGSWSCRCCRRRARSSATPSWTWRWTRSAS